MLKVIEQWILWEALFLLGLVGLIVVCSLAEEAARPLKRWREAHHWMRDAAQSPPVRKCAPYLVSRHRATRLETVAILEMLSDRSAVPALLRALERYSKDPPFQQAVVNALAQLDDPRALPALRALTHNHTYALMQAAREALAVIEPKAELLRGAEAPVAISAMLLRPVSKAVVTEPQQLLRPSAAEQKSG